MSLWRGVMTGGGVALIVAAALLGFRSAPADSAAVATISIEPASMNAVVGDDAFNLEVRVSNVNNLGAYDLTLAFDNDLLEYMGSAGGDFLTSTGRSASCVPPTTIAKANSQGVLHFGCNTVGLVENDEGKPGPDGSGLLAIFAFKPEAAGSADITFEGVGIGLEVGGELLHTDLATVEVCGDPCESQPIVFETQNAIIAVTAPGQATPTGVPSTPTRVPRSPTPNVQATVQAVLTPSRRLGTPVAGQSGSVGNVSGRPGATPRSGVLPQGSTTGAGSAPVAGHGPQQQSNPWPERTVAVLAVAGAGALAAGVIIQRRRQSLG